MNSIKAWSTLCQVVRVGLVTNNHSTFVLKTTVPRLLDYGTTSARQLPFSVYLGSIGLADWRAGA